MKKIVLALFLSASLLLTLNAQNQQQKNALEKLYNIINITSNQVNYTIRKINEAYLVHDEIVKERTDAVINVYYMLKNKIQDLMKTTVYEGVHKKVTANKYKCIAKSVETFNKTFNKKFYEMYEGGLQIKNDSVKGLIPYTYVLNKFMSFFFEFRDDKVDELLHETEEDEIKKILEDVSEKMKVTGEVADEVNTEIEDVKFQFFEEYVDFLHDTENFFKAEYGKAVKKIPSCLN